MLGTWSARVSARAGKLAGATLILEAARTTLRTRRKAAWAGLWTAVKNWLAALDSRSPGIGSSRWSGRWRRWWRSLVDGPGPGLRHHYFAHLRYRSGGRSDGGRLLGIG
jgi:hypothetical protein